MAFNLAALKGLFGKLKPAAKTVTNYGDDVAGVVANYGDDAAKALTTYGDDVAQMTSSNTNALSDFFDDNGNLLQGSDVVTINGKQFHYPDLAQYNDDEFDYLLGSSEKVRQDYLKDRLLSKRTSGELPFNRYASRVPVAGYDLMPPSNASVSYYSVKSPSTVTALGDYVDGIPTTHSVRVPELNAKDLVIQQADLDRALPLDGVDYGLRPHRNTKLGKWFRQQIPTYGFEVDVDPTTSKHPDWQDLLPF